MFPDIIVNLATAMICFNSTCYPALVGVDTPKGEYQLQHYSTKTPGYGGDILVFKEDGDDVYAIHRIIDVPGEQRLVRIHMSDPKYRITVTHGCINVEPEVYEKLMDCCYKSKVIIE